MDVNDLLLQANQLEKQQKSTEAGALLIDAVDKVVQTGDIPETIGLILFRIGLNFLGTDLEANGFESIEDGLAQLDLKGKNLQNYSEQLARFLLNSVWLVGTTGNLKVSQDVMNKAFPLIEQGRINELEVLIAIISHGLLCIFAGNIAEAQKYISKATQMNQTAQNAPANLLIQLVNTLISFSSKEYSKFLVQASGLLGEAVLKENYHIIAFLASMVAKAFVVCGNASDASLWWSTSEVAASRAHLKKLQIFAGERKKELEYVLAAKAMEAENKIKHTPTFTPLHLKSGSQIIPKSPFADMPSSAPSPPAPVEAPNPNISLNSVTPQSPKGEQPTQVPRKEELFHQIDSVKQLLKDIDDVLPTAADPAALRQQKSIMRKKLRDLQEEYEKIP